MILALLTLTTSWTLLLAVRIFLFADKTHDQPADAAIVLGAAVAGDVPTPVFEQRIQHAVTLYQTGAVPALILTGGLGAGDRLAESEAARNYCLSRGIPARKIFLETRSRSTEENLKEARQILLTHQFRRVLIVTDPLHERRAITIARDLGIDAYLSPTPTTRYVGVMSRGGFLMRETYFYGRYLLLRLFQLKNG
jgi:uncharacterized SAM-binding protein YcdF (DUF218 family)